MSKYRSREAPVEGSSLSTERPGYLADRIKLDRNIRYRWFKDYGYLLYGEQPHPVLSTNEPYQHWIHGHGEAEKGPRKTHGCISGPRWPPKGPIPQVTSDLTEPDTRTILTAPIAWYNYDDNLAKQNVLGQRQDVSYGLEDKAPKMVYDYPTPGNTQKHHVVKDHVTAYSSSYGHHSVQFRNQYPMCAPKPDDFCGQIQSSPHSNRPVQTKHPADLDKAKSSSSSFDCCDRVDKQGIPYTPEAHVDLDKLSMQVNACSLAETQRQLESIPPAEVCPKCENRLCCTCVPRRREKVPEDPEEGPNKELAPWPPQVWYGPSYNGSRIGTSGDIVRLRWRLSRDPEGKTPMNRMYDEVKARNYYGNEQHVHTGEDFYSCGICRTAREAARSTWFDEQLNKKNPFTTGDTQFKSCAYMKKF